MSKFENLNLHPKLLEALTSKGYTDPTPIQEQAIPHLLDERDFLGIAQTGTGKTAAFSLPILQNLTKSNIKVKPNSIRCLILTPTRELATQIADNIATYGSKLHLKHAVIFGGVNEKPQIANLKRGMDIVIATPGRLLDLMSQGHIRYSQLEIFVLDEADRMLDMGFIHDIKKVIAKLPEDRQTLFFSATMPDTIAKLASSILIDPITVEITPPSTTVEKIDQKIYFVEKSNKSALLKHILKKDGDCHMLVFLRTKHGANRLADFLLRHGITAGAIHGNKSQSAREKALASFRSGETNVLLATDIAARGIDVPGITHVVNFDIPKDPESYVHRIGRTARAGKDGIAISFCDPSERKSLKAVEKSINYDIRIDRTHAYHGVDGTTEKEFAGERRQPRAKREEPASPAKKRFGAVRGGFGGRDGGSRSESNYSKPRSEGDGFGKRRSEDGNSSNERSERRNEGGGRSNERFGRRNDENGRSGDRFERRGEGGGRSNDRFGKRNEDGNRSNDRSERGDDNRGNSSERFGRRNEGFGSQSAPKRTSRFGVQAPSQRGELVDRPKATFGGKKSSFKKKSSGNSPASAGRTFNGRNRNTKKKGF
jgi:ATP-dependent RNA helicase RhlE